jgi:hypothetical protein
MAQGNFTNHPKTPVIDRFLAKVSPDPNSGCWLWMASCNQWGYGHFKLTKTKPIGAHVFAYRHYVGPIPEGLELDHLCRVRCCCNPRHLEAVTHQENCARGVSDESMRKTQAEYAKIKKLKTHCKRGHEYATHAVISPKNGVRTCRTCAIEKMAEWRRGHPNAWSEWFKNRSSK